MDLQQRLLAAQQQEAALIAAGAAAGQEMNVADPLAAMATLCQRFGISNELAQHLEGVLKLRPLTAYNDIVELTNILAKAPSANVSLMFQIKQMQNGKFVSKFPLPGLEQLKARFQTVPAMLWSAIEAELHKRPTSVEGDIDTIETALNSAHVPTTILQHHLKTLKDGTFVSYPPNQALIYEMTNIYGVQISALNGLSRFLMTQGKARGKIIIQRVCTHIERTDQPMEQMIAKLVRQLAAGEEIQECTGKPMHGSYLWRKEKEANGGIDIQQPEAPREERAERREDRRDDRERDRGRDQDKDKDRGRDRGRDRGGDRKDDRRRSRSNRASGTKKDGEKETDKDTKEKEPRERDRDRDRDRGKDKEKDKDKDKDKDDTDKVDKSDKADKADKAAKGDKSRGRGDKSRGRGDKDAKDSDRNEGRGRRGGRDRDRDDRGDRGDRDDDRDDRGDRGDRGRDRDRDRDRGDRGKSRGDRGDRGRDRGGSDSRDRGKDKGSRDRSKDKDSRDRGKDKDSRARGKDKGRSKARSKDRSEDRSRSPDGKDDAPLGRWRK